MNVAINSLNSLQKEFKDEIKPSKLFWVDLDKLVEEPGFNVRDYSNPDTAKHIERLKAAYIRGEQIDPVKVVVREGVCYIRDGHCRRLGALEARKAGAPVSRIECIEFRGDAIEEITQIATSNDGLKLNSVELARIYQRLINHGKTLQEIGLLITKTDEHVRQTIKLLTLPVELQQKIHEGLAPSLVLETYSEHGEDAVAALEKGIQLQKKTGKSKVTPRMISAANGQAMPRMGKKVVHQMYSSVKSITSILSEMNLDLTPGGTINIVLTSEQATSLLELKDTLTAQELKAQKANEEAMASNSEVASVSEHEKKNNDQDDSTKDPEVIKSSSAGEIQLAFVELNNSIGDASVPPTSNNVHDFVVDSSESQDERGLDDYFSPDHNEIGMDVDQVQSFS